MILKNSEIAGIKLPSEQLKVSANWEAKIKIMIPIKVEMLKPNFIE